MRDKKNKKSKNKWNILGQRTKKKDASNPNRKLDTKQTRTQADSVEAVR
jgi:hypothetical protein